MNGRARCSSLASPHSAPWFGACVAGSLYSACGTPKRNARTPGPPRLTNRPSPHSWQSSTGWSAPATWESSHATESVLTRPKQSSWRAGGEQIEALAASVADRLTELETAAPEPRNPDHIAAFDAANRVLGQALERRRWTDADAATMQDIVRRLHAEDAAELRGRLAVAVNDQELELGSRDTF